MRIGKLARTAIALALLTAVAAQPAMALLRTYDTNNQRLVGVRRNGNYSQRLGTRYGTGKVIVYSDLYNLSVNLLGRGEVQNRSGYTQYYYDIGTWISLPNNAGRLRADGDYVTVYGVPFFNYGYNVTAAYFSL